MRDASCRRPSALSEHCGDSPPSIPPSLAWSTCSSITRYSTVCSASVVTPSDASSAGWPHLWPGTATEFESYGYQTWIIPSECRMFMLWGAYGQRIYVDPQSKLVMVNTAVHKLAFDLSPLQEMGVLWSALVSQLGG